jgi:outer membrane protein assembly factor BamE (lipoprotein component of BamABCDE complex)
MKIALTLPLTALAIFAVGCIPVTHAPQGEQMTVAKVQREIKVGMSSSDVVEILGAPNMVTTDDERRETWVYDKVSTEVSSSKSQSGVWLLIAGAGQSGSRTSQNQKTLTIVIKFDQNNKVRDFAYRTSTF